LEKSCAFDPQKKCANVFPCGMAGVMELEVVAARERIKEAT